jgi:hypothetical protein
MKMCVLLLLLFSSFFFSHGDASADSPYSSRWLAQSRCVAVTVTLDVYTHTRLTLLLLSRRTLSMQRGTSASGT